jgi:D-cysteine desulfhydrase
VAANLPTPVHRLNTSVFQNSALQVFKDLDIDLYVKRDDMSGGPELGGNKIRKLEFLLADALSNEKTDCVVTIGGDQSNHCRATASAARLVGLEPHLILRTRTAVSVGSNKNKTNKHDEAGDEKLGLKGNILFDRLVGSQIYTVTPGEYGRFGQAALLEQLQYLLKTQSRNPYLIPVGGSNALGTWGYLEAVQELMSQLEESSLELDHVVFACGSGGTLTGIALGIHLYHQYYKRHHSPHCHAVGVCDSPDYFYERMAEIGEGMGMSHPAMQSALSDVRNWTTVHNGKGQGYAVSRPEEMEMIQQFARDTGIVLDPVYSGKAMYHFVTDTLRKEPEKYRGTKVLF